MDHSLETLPPSELPSFVSNQLKTAEPYRLLDNDHMKNELLPQMLKKAEEIAQQQRDQITKQRAKEMNQALDQEIQRLENLQKVNHHVRPIELTLARTQKDQLQKALAEATLRLDAVRVIWKTPEPA